jgi:hypothetical protein
MKPTVKPDQCFFCQMPRNGILVRTPNDSGQDFLAELPQTFTRCCLVHLLLPTDQHFFPRSALLA